MQQQSMFPDISRTCGSKQQHPGFAVQQAAHSPNKVHVTVMLVHQHAGIGQPFQLFLNILLCNHDVIATCGTSKTAERQAAGDMHD